MAEKKPKKDAKFSTYSNLAKKSKSKRTVKKDDRARKKAEYLATLPKNPVKRFFYRLHPKRFFKYWFSRDGLKMMLKIAGVAVLLLVLFVGALFAYYRKELNSLNPEELAKRVQTTVSRYYDRNGVLLWEDTGTGDYRLVVESDQISQYMKDATVAIEDKEFYKHGGVSASGIARALVNNAGGSGGSQGGSTLTQQLIKQVYFTDSGEAQERGFAGIPRKIKEAILAVEAERIYNKDQLLTLYLNESPYGGRRNGVESAAQTYFGKSAKDLSLAEAALLASIPQSPGLYNPYNIDGNASLLGRQRTTLDYMAEQGYITKEQAEAAKKVPVLDSIKPVEDQFQNVKAPHFVQMVKSELESELGSKVVGQGGLTIKTTLDVRAQDIVDSAINDVFAGSAPTTIGFDNASATMIDSQTGQILALRGSRDYNYPDYGSVNAATAFIQPGSSIKPEVYASLLQNNHEYGAGSIIPDTAIPQNIYRTDGSNSVRNADGRFKGNIPIRQSLGESRNVPVIKAMAIVGRDTAIDTIHQLGDLSYCTDGVDQQAGLSSAIGGCGAKQTEHTNAFATFARMGVYKPVASVLEVKNNSGQVLKKWTDEGKQAINSEIAYILSDILSDDAARAGVFGRGLPGFNVNGVKTATKSGTSDTGGQAKDLWMMSYSPKASLSVWFGNHVPKAVRGESKDLGITIGNIMHDSHYNVFQPDGTWKPGDWFERPAGVQTLSVNGRSDLFPSWYKKSNAATTEKIVFDKVSKKRATDCTPEAAKIEVEIAKTEDPLTKKLTYTAKDGYDPNANDDVHKCDDTKPFVAGITATSLGSGKFRITATVNSGSHAIDTVTLSVGGNNYNASASGSDYSIVVDNLTGSQAVTVNATDQALYSGTGSQTLNFTSSGSGT